MLIKWRDIDENKTYWRESFREPVKVEEKNSKMELFFQEQEIKKDLNRAEVIAIGKGEN